MSQAAGTLALTPDVELLYTPVVEKGLLTSIYNPDLDRTIFLNLSVIKSSGGSSKANLATSSLFMEEVMGAFTLSSSRRQTPQPAPVASSQRQQPTLIRSLDLEYGKLPPENIIKILVDKLLALPNALTHPDTKNMRVFVGENVVRLELSPGTSLAIAPGVKNGYQVQVLNDGVGSSEQVSQILGETIKNDPDLSIILPYLLTQLPNSLFHFV